ncbi:hypothetical protein [Chryseobacterium oncorhynchi]|uniref:Uncharacterized protein n=1 Tax=Chryseobacterium oncorhynchi TaxID=741074 RepID=A0A316WF93_9FLAO|nr:hypothetical protein [Chryseobacterium oncorhynchi]PWN60057.1 hypothetical protein C1638_021045 [Chryseobacterium oncorhynchi]
MEAIKYSTEKEALKEAQRLSEKNSLVLHVIKSDEQYYLDENGLLRAWETLIAAFENGRRIK